MSRSPDELSETLPATGPQTVPAKPSDATLETLAAPPSNPPISGIDATVAAPGDSTVRPKPPSSDAVAFEQPPVDAALYEVTREIGRGGMGRVVAARDRRLDRPVALKLLTTPSPDVAERFRREARITAQLQHPGIVPIYEAGRLGKEPFYAMKHVAGVPMDRLVTRAKTTRERLALLPNILAVADALAFAHARRVVHRDLKPQNVIVGEYGETVVIDWGLAKDLSEEESPGERSTRDDAGPYRSAGDGSLTVVGSIMGTPAYMPPEQARGEAVDERADVYAIGAMTYHALTGSFVHEGENTEDLLGKVMVAAKHVPLLEKAPDVPADLAAIVEKALAANPDNRYDSAGALAEDLRRFQTGQLVGVHRYSLGTLVKRWIKRHRGVVAVGAAALVIVGVLATIGIARIRDERAAAVAANEQAQAARVDADQRRLEAERERATAQAQSDEAVLAQAASLSTVDPAAAIAWLERMSPTSTRMSAARTIAADALHHGISDLLPWPGFAPSRVIVDETGKLLALHNPDIERLVVYDLDARQVRDIAVPRNTIVGPLAGDGKSLAISTSANAQSLLDTMKSSQIEIVDLVTRQRRPIANTTDMFPLAFTPDGSGLLARTPTGAAMVSTTGGAHRNFVADMDALRLSADGRSILAHGKQSKVLRRYDVATGEAREIALPVAFDHYAISPDGSRVAGRTKADAPIQVVDLASGSAFELFDSVLRLGANGWAPPVAFDDTQSVVIAWGGTIVRWDADSGERKMFTTPSPLPTVATVSIRGTRVFALDTELVVSTGRHELKWRQPGKVDRLALAGDGKTLFVVGGDSTLRRWRVAPTTEGKTCGGVSRLPFVEATPDGRRLVQQGPRAGMLEICELATGKVSWLTAGTRPIYEIGFSLDGQTVVTSAEREQPEVVVWNLATRSARVIDVKLEPRAVADGGTQLVGSIGAGDNGMGELAIVEVATGKVEPRCPGMGNASVSADARVAVVTTTDKIAICDLGTNTVREYPNGFVGGHDLVIAPNGAFAVGVNGSGAVRWDLATGARTALDFGAIGWAKVAMARDSSRVALVDGSVGGVFDAKGTLVHRVRIPPGYLEQVWFSPDGTRLLTADHDNGATIYDLVTGQRRSVRGPETTVRASFLADGTGLISLGGTGDTSIWYFRDDLPHDAAALRAWIGNASGAKIDADGRLAGSL